MEGQRGTQREEDIQEALTEKKDETRSRTQVTRKEYNKDMQMWNFIAIGPLSKLTIPLAVPKIKDHF